MVRIDLNKHFYTNNNESKGTLAEWLTRWPAMSLLKLFSHFLRERVFESHRCRKLLFCLNSVFWSTLSFSLPLSSSLRFRIPSCSFTRYPFLFCSLTRC
ncbi:hypothetical protein BDZ45DRAFT_488971 [Acephala macrosclerotiorum]|nr:hypothetical protein BDZ45DRAFT_488971 [Acephala macrosclerotiorum]